MKLKNILLAMVMSLAAGPCLAQDNLERVDNVPTDYIKGAYPYYFGTIDGVLYVFLGSSPSILVRYPALDPRETFTIPTTVSRISKGAFKDCRNLREIIIPSSVIYIGDDAFDGVEIERFVVMGNDVTTQSSRIESAAPEDTRFYDLSGHEIPAPNNGLSIRLERGTATKILTP